MLIARPASAVSSVHLVLLHLSALAVVWQGVVVQLVVTPMWMVQALAAAEVVVAAEGAVAAVAAVPLVVQVVQEVVEQGVVEAAALPAVALPRTHG